MKITQEEKLKAREVAEKYGLKFIILHGSYATGKIHPGSDLDVAILGESKIVLDQYLAIHGALADIFGDNKERELDLKDLWGADPLFKYYVLRDSLLFYGNITEFNEFKAYVFRQFDLLQDILQLEETLIKKQNKLLCQSYA